MELSIAFGLIVLLGPLLGLIAASVRRGSHGPVLFRQKRHGKDQTAFELLKFRTMYCSERPDPDVTQASRLDPRVTPIGRLLRRTSLDELPQLWNVIKGDMSLVGPRPHAVEHDSFYGPIIPRYTERFRAKPGITGLAQVSGARGATPRPEDMRARIDLDLQYLESASFALDCRILLRTVKEVIGSDAAF
jgi:lipopolysaccharide/colanic/teichoic acid biosynthesis glycosyltransferase